MDCNCSPFCISFPSRSIFSCIIGIVHNKTLILPSFDCGLYDIFTNNKENNLAKQRLTKQRAQWSALRATGESVLFLLLSVLSFIYLFDASLLTTSLLSIDLIKNTA